MWIECSKLIFDWILKSSSTIHLRLKCHRKIAMAIDSHATVFWIISAHFISLLSIEALARVFWKEIFFCSFKLFSGFSTSIKFYLTPREYSQAKLLAPYIFKNSKLLGFGRANATAAKVMCATHTKTSNWSMNFAIFFFQSTQ